MKTTQLSESFTYEDFLARHDGEARVLFVINDKDKIHPILAGEKVAPETDWQLISLVPPKAAMDRKAEGESSQATSGTG